MATQEKLTLGLLALARLLLAREALAQRALARDPRGGLERRRLRPALVLQQVCARQRRSSA